MTGAVGVSAPPDLIGLGQGLRLRVSCPVGGLRSE